MSSEVKANKISPATGTALQISDSGDTTTIPSGATLDVNGTLDVTGATVTGLSAGKVLQVVQGAYASQTSTNGTTYVTTGLSASITPSSTSNKVLVTGVINSFYNYASGAQVGGYLALYRGGSAIVDPIAWSFTNDGNNLLATVPLNYLDSPSSTSSVTYEVYFRISHGSTSVVHDSGNPSYLTLMEIEA